MEGTSCDSSYHCRDGYPCQSCRSVLECPASKMCHLSTKDQYVCQSNHRIAEAVTSVLGSAQFSACPFYHPRSSRCRFGHPREAVVGAGNFPDSNDISDYFKRQNRSHKTEPVPSSAKRAKWVRISCPFPTHLLTTGETPPCRCSRTSINSSTSTNVKPTSIRSGGKIGPSSVPDARARTLIRGGCTTTDRDANATGVTGASAPSMTSPTPCCTRANGHSHTGYWRP